jgi:DNA-directed RNA polymerase subunit beta
MRDEDDDLLRAAEELGIDLSGVRAIAGDGPADEALEGEDTTDAAASEDGDADAPAADAEDLDVGSTEDVDLADLDSEVSAE